MNKYQSDLLSPVAGNEGQKLTFAVAVSSVFVVIAAAASSAAVVEWLAVSFVAAAVAAAVIEVAGQALSC